MPICASRDCDTPSLLGPWCQQCFDEIAAIEKQASDITKLCGVTGDTNAVLFLSKIVADIAQLVTQAVPNTYADDTVRPFIESEIQDLSLEAKIYVLGKILYKSGLWSMGLGEGLRPKLTVVK